MNSRKLNTPTKFTNDILEEILHEMHPTVGITISCRPATGICSPQQNLHTPQPLATKRIPFKIQVVPELRMGWQLSTLASVAVLLAAV